jgi:two-component system CheB/CheR fusion protein
VLLPVADTTPFALVLHELGTNALKYGAWSVERGYVDVSWRVDDHQLVFRWRERGDLSIALPLRTGLGSKLIKDGLSGACAQHDLKPDGLECVIRLPLAR